MYSHTPAMPDVPHSHLPLVHCELVPQVGMQLEQVSSSWHVLKIAGLAAIAGSAYSRKIVAAQPSWNARNPLKAKRLPLIVDPHFWVNALDA
jgi:hypothetical protein